MPARSRSRIVRTLHGSRVSGSPFNTSATKTSSSYEYCNDYVGNPNGDNALRITMEDMQGPVLNGPSGVHSFTNWPTTGVGYYPALPTTLEMTSALKAFAPRVYSQTGPLTPSLNIPRLIIELRELPMMLKHAGDLLLKLPGARPIMKPDSEIASATLAYQFGWAPLIGDLSKMLKLTAIIDRRHRELEKAHSERGLKRRISLPDGGDETTGSESAEVFLDTSGSQTTKGRRTNSVSCKRWATIRWKSADPADFAKPPPSRQFAAAVATGFTLGAIPATLWQVLPWTWAIDWFAGVAARLQATQNLWSYTPSSACVMETRVSKDTWRITQNTAGLAISGLVNTRTVKTRVVLAPSDLLSNPIKLPYLDGFKLSILGSLAVLRIRGR